MALTGSVRVNTPYAAAATVVLATPMSPGMIRSAPESISLSATSAPAARAASNTSGEVAASTSMTPVGASR